MLVEKRKRRDETDFDELKSEKARYYIYDDYKSKGRVKEFFCRTKIF